VKRPAFQFYPADWRKDVELQSCSMAAQGLWINVMCVAHECEPYGHLTVNGKGMTSAQLGRQVGLSGKEADALLVELMEAGVARRTADGTIYSKRMVADEDLRNRRATGGQAGAEHGGKGAKDGSKGGRPKIDKGGLETPLPGFEKPPPSSSSSSSPSGEYPHTPKGADLFDEFWKAYPKKVGKDAAAKAFARRKPGKELLALMLAALDLQKATDQWRRDGGQYVPHPSTWLNEGRWQDGEAMPDQQQETIV
jgi:hypothetical protein